MQTPLTRREFIQRVGAVGGGAAALHAMTVLGFLKEGGSDQAFAAPRLTAGTKRVIILGAGIAGMCAAYELTRAGFDCVVLEATKRAGGRNRTARRGDVLKETDSSQTCTFDADANLYMNTGPARISYHHRAILRYCKTFGVTLEPHISHNRAAFVHEAALGSDAVRQRQAYADSRGYIAELLVKSVEGHALDAELTAEDQLKLLDWLSEFGGLDGDRRYVGNERAGYANQDNAGLGGGVFNVPLPLARYLDSTAWWRDWDEVYDQQMTMLQPVGGMDKIAAAFASRVGAQLRLGAVVTDIQNTGSGVQVAYTQSGNQLVISGDLAICTIPCTVLSGIPSNLGASTKAAIANVTYQRSVKVGFQSTRWWEDEHYIYGGITWTDQPMTQLWYPSAGFHRRKGILLGAYTWNDNRDGFFQGLSPAARLQAAASQGERIHPGYAARMTHGLSRAWGKVPFQLGSWTQDESANPAALRTSDGAVYFAGEHMSALPGWQEGAILSAQKTVSDITLAALAAG